MFRIIFVSLMCLLVAAILFEVSGPLDTRPLVLEAAGTSFLTVGLACMALLIIAMLLGDSEEHYD